MNAAIIIFITIFVVIFGSHQVIARPNNRIKRVSDSHLADLETRIALNNKLRGISITVPIGGGRIDPYRIGRRRRSESRILDTLFNQSEEDKGDPVEVDYDDVYTYQLQSK